ncbi:uncharacterized protein ofcc1 isoform X2 [Alosa sapidissima]|nr:uncharacterized protein ofcc1 isoform X2 [Alosa sapidissima]
MDTFGSKLEQKAQKQPKQKKSNSAEFLMGEEEERKTLEGIENPAFCGDGMGAEGGGSRGDSGGGGGGAGVGGSQDPSWAVRPTVWREMRGDRQDSTLAAQQQQTKLQGPANARGNERARNYFDPQSSAEANPRRFGTAEASAEDELELKFLNEDEKTLYHKLSQMLSEDDASTIIDLPGTVLPSGGEEAQETRAVAVAGACGSVPAASRWRDGLRREAEEGREEVIPRYVEQLRERVQDDMIPLGCLSLQQEANTGKGGMSPEREWARKRGLMAFLRENAKVLNCVQKKGRLLEESDCQGQNHQEETILQDKLYASFQRAEGRLLKALREQRGEVITKYGQLTAATAMDELPHSSPMEPALHWQVEWAHTPQPIEVRLHGLRAVRDKLPRGQYAVSVAFHSQLGGPALCWSRLKESQWASTTTTEPVEHRGRFYDTELNINQSIYAVLPAPCDVLPCSVLLFRLLSLPGECSHVSAVVSWAAFPVCDASLRIVQGKFKSPFLRGRPDPNIDQFRKIESLVSTDVDNWLCNLYFQVKKLPRGSHGVPERSVALHIPPQTQPCSSERPAPSSCSSTSEPGKNSSGMLPIPGRSEEKSDPFTAKAKPGTQHKGMKQKKPINKINSWSTSWRGSPVPPPPPPPPQLQPPALQPRKQEAHWRLVTEELEEYTFSLQPQHPSGVGGVGGGLAAERGRLALRLLPCELGLTPRRHCCARLLQLGLIIPLVALMWFIRLYLHYCSQWLFLQAIAVPVNKFQFHAHTVELVYQNSLLHTREELAMVVLGPLTLNAVTLLLLLIRWACQLLFASLPSFLSKFIMALAVWTLLDPLAVFVVDAILGRLAYSADHPVGDAAKLYWHLLKTEQSGAAGIIVTLFLYAVHFLLSLTILYIYFIRLHNDGRVLDVYQRLHSPEGSFFVPQDLEVSNQELNYIIKKAEQWRGFNGERRKVAVYDYIWTEEEPGAMRGGPDPPGATTPAGEGGGGERSTHVSIYTLHLSGLRQRYRHFLRQPEGAIVEVIGDIDGVPHMDDEASQPGHRMDKEEEEEHGASSSQQLRERKRKKPFFRSHRVEPVGGSMCDSTLQDLPH